MGLYADITAAEARIAELRASLDAAEANLASFEARIVKGGPDVSASQGDVDWAKVRAAGYDIVFPKVADGDILDPTFTPSRIAAIKAVGLSYAPYYFARVASAGNGMRDGRIEAAMAVYFAGKQGWGKKGDLPLVYDFENLNGQTAQAAKDHFVQFVTAYKGLMGHAPIVYTMPAFWNGLAPGTAIKAAAAECPLWIAHWGVSTPSVPAPWTDWTFWQYTDRASVPGVTVAVDNSRANIDKSALDALRIT